MSIAEFFAMGGYANYVWGSFGITFAILLGNFFVTRRQEQRIKSEIAATLATESHAEIR